MSSSVALAVPDGAVTPGEELACTVTVAGEGATRLRAELFYVNSYLTPGPDTANTQSSGDSMFELATDLAVEAAPGGPEEAREDYVVVASAARTPADGPVAGEHALRLLVPTGAPPTVAGIVQWKVRATVDRTAGPPDEAAADVAVASTVAAAGAELQAGTVWDDQFEIRIDGGQAFRAGGTVTGTVVVTPKKSLSLNRVRLELHAHRADRGGIKHVTSVAKADVTGKTKLDGGVRRELPFALPVPADALPSFVADNNRLDHRLTLSADRKLRTDLNAATEVAVVSPRSSAH